ncbi:MAG: hypothetical protein Q8P50_01595 [Bacillota bacterium]|nr:hypothetical protein [Bacillota bacterium]
MSQLVANELRHLRTYVLILLALLLGMGLIARIADNDSLTMIVRIWFVIAPALLGIGTPSQSFKAEERTTPGACCSPCRSPHRRSCGPNTPAP